MNNSRRADELTVTPAALLPQVQFSEAELLAGDRLNNIAKNMGVDFSARYRLQHELNEGGVA